jgi:hypothetical protein
MEAVSRVFISDEDNKSCFVFIDTIVFGEVSSFLLYCTGDPRKLRRLYLRIKDKLHNNIYYKLDNVDIFKNHSEEVLREDGEILYKYIGGL